MSIGPALMPQSFDPAQLRAMADAFDMCCASLGLSDRADPLTQMIAIQVVEAATGGESDPGRLYAAVMRWASAAA